MGGKETGREGRGEEEKETPPKSPSPKDVWNQHSRGSMEGECSVADFMALRNAIVYIE